MQKNAVQVGKRWFKKRGWKPFDFQLDSWKAFSDGKSGILNAPTGSGKTLALLLPLLLTIENQGKEVEGVSALWISPVRALAPQIKTVAENCIEDLGLKLKVGMRTGDSSAAERKRQLNKPPDLLITTPESLHQWLSHEASCLFLKKVRCMVVDEWHELMVSKRGIQVELAAALLKSWTPTLQLWGISATLGRKEEALDILLGPDHSRENSAIIKAGTSGEIQLQSLYPDDIFELPWAGHLGIKMLQKVCQQIEKAESTLVFTNTRSQCEIWYQRLLDAMPDMAGQMAMHHSAIDEKLRHWVEDELHSGRLKVVVCTSSLDLGVDFGPVEQVVQIGGPKGVNRLIQRAGRSGHRPGMPSRVYFVPTHAIELLEASAIRSALKEGIVESPLPHLRSFDVLIQFMMTLACSLGYHPDSLFEVVKKTFCFQSVSEAEWASVIRVLRFGGEAMESYDEFKRVDFDKTGKIRVLNRGIARRHRLSIGTITSDQTLMVQYQKGKKLGSVEEWFLSRLSIGDTFWFAGRALRLEGIRRHKVLVSRSSSRSAKVPSWMGGRMPLSSLLSRQIRAVLNACAEGKIPDEEIRAIQPLLKIQTERSAIPAGGELLIEYFRSHHGYHLFFYPFEGRLVHEGLAALISKRIADKINISFSMSMNDYGFELLSSRDWNPREYLTSDLFSEKNLQTLIADSIQEVELAKRKFRDIALISGLMFRGFPGREKKARHLQSSAGLLFDVYGKYDPDNLLFLQAYEEVHSFQLEEARTRETLRRISAQKMVFKQLQRPSPLSLPLMADRLRTRISSEKAEERLKNMLSGR